MFARSHGVLHTIEMRRERERERTDTRNARERERETGTIVIFPARDSARRKRTRGRATEVRGPTGRHRTFEPVGKKSPKSGSKM